MSVDRSSTDEALRGLRIADTRYCRTELSAPWGLEMEPCPIATFHFVAHGRCLLVGAGEDRRLETGQFVVFPRGSGHRLLSAPGQPADPVTPLHKLRIGPSSSLLRHGGGGESTLLLCGGSSFAPSDHPLVTLLPEVLTVEPAGHLSGIVPILEAEAARPGVGSDAMVTRLSDILILHAVRTWLQNAAHDDGRLAALRDEGLGRALSALHQAPERGWTVATLAAQARMSRSLFARRFTEMLGDTPMDYVAQVRMRRATSLMQERGLSLSQVASRVGYQSPAAFSRAYKRVTGRPPGAARTTPDG